MKRPCFCDINERRNYSVQRIDKKPWVTCFNYWQRILYVKDPTTRQRLERKISFICLFIHSCRSLFSFYSFYFFLASFRIFPSAFSHSHPPSAGIWSASYRHRWKILETIEYSGNVNGNSLGFCHSVEQLIKSRTNFHNVMKQTTTGQAFKKWRNLLKFNLIKK